MSALLDSGDRQEEIEGEIGMALRCWVFDVDGTLADCSHRLNLIQPPADWDGFFDACDKDIPIEHMCDLAAKLWNFDPVVMVTGRPERIRQKTEAWLSDYAVPCRAMYMRQDGDHRPGGMVKSELLDRMLADGFEPIMVFENSASEAKMWRERGIPCALVEEDDYQAHQTAIVRLVKEGR